MTQKDILEALLDTAGAFLRKRGGICNGYEYRYPTSIIARNDIRNHSFVRRKKSFDDVIDAGILYLSGCTEDEVRPYGDLFGKPYVTVSASGVFEAHEGEGAFSMKVSVQDGQITDITVYGNTGYIAEEVIPVFTNKMHRVRYPDCL